MDFVTWCKERKLDADKLDAETREVMERIYKQEQETVKRAVEAALAEKVKVPAPPKAEDKAAARGLAVELREMAPRHLDPKAVDAEILAAADLADGKKRLLDLAAKTQAAVGTPEPATPPDKKPDDKKPEEVRSEINDLLKRGLAD